MTLREALAHVNEYGFGDLVDADSLIEQAATELLAIYDKHGLGRGRPEAVGAWESVGDTGPAQCADLYALFEKVGMHVS